MKLALGTAQFGMAYGTFNRTGQVPLLEIHKILDFAASKGVGVLDTAHSYGSSEEVLGQIDAGARFDVVTKIPALNGLHAAVRAPKLFSQSLDRLRLGRVYGLLLHRAADLFEEGADALWQSLEALKVHGQVQKIGFSASGPEEALQILQRFPVDLVQIPMNVFDARHRDSAVLALCQERGVEVHARSVFLQGFALAVPDELTGHLAKYRGLLSAFRTCCAKLGVSPLHGALQYALKQLEVTRVVVGTDSLAQCEDIVRASCGAQIAFPSEFESVRCDDLDLIDPSRWH